MKRFSFLFFIIFSILLLPLVHAVGFSNLPSERQFVFTPGFTMDIPVFPSNAEHVHLILGTPQGDPATLGTPEDDNIQEYVTLEDPDPDGPPRQAVIHMKFPQQLKPGDYNIGVVAQDVQIGGGTVSAVASTKLQFTLHVLSPTKRIDIRGLQVLPVPEGVNANATVFVISRTSQNIDNIFAEFHLYKEDQLISTTNSRPISLLSSESAELFTIINTQDLPGGEYIVNAIVHFDGYQNYTANETLKIGTLHVGLTDATTNFTFNTTNQFLFNISNQWNRELQDVYTQVKIGSQSKKSASQNIAPFKNTQYELYFDREEAIVPGVTVANIVVTYKDFDPLSKTYVAKQESFNSTINVVVPFVPEEKFWQGDMLVYVLVGGIVFIIILILILIIVVLLKKTRNSSSQTQSTTTAAPSVPPKQASVPVQSAVRPAVQVNPTVQKPVIQENWQPPKK